MNTPLRIGATSFVYPGGWADNVERLAGRVDDVEILLFEPELPDAAELRALATLKRAAELTYSVHTPLGVSLASESEARREESVRLLRWVLEATAPLEPETFVVHVYLGDHEGDAPPRDRSAWRERACRSLQALLGSGVPPARLCVESLDYDFRLIEPVLAELGLSAALDLGHVIRDGGSELDVLARNLHHTRLVQWHGVEPRGRDHRSLAHVPRERARGLVDALIAARYAGVVTLEVFREDDFEESLSLLRDLVREAAA